MFKKLLSAAFCALTLASVAIPANAAGTFGKGSPVKEGSAVKIGKTLVTMVNNYRTEQTRIYRSKLNGKKLRLVAKTPMYPDSQLYSYKSRVYYRKGEKIMVYNPKSGKKSTAVKLDPKNKFKLSDKKGFLIKVAGLTKYGFIVNYRGEGLALVSFDGNKTVFDSNAKTSSVYIASNSKFAFYYKCENKKSSRFICDLYRYSFISGESEKLQSFKTVKKAKTAPDTASAYVAKKKVIFNAGEASDGLYEGSTYSMNSDGTDLKKLKEYTGSSLTPAKNGAYISYTTEKGVYILYKITPSGKLKSAVNYKNGNYPLISYTDENGGALAISVSRFNYGYDVYSLKKVKKAKGKKVLDADSRIKNTFTGDVVVSPSITGSVGSVALVTYGVYCYSGSTLIDVYKCESFLINTKTGNKVRIDK